MLVTVPGRGGEAGGRERGVDDTLQPRAILTATATGSDGSVKTFSVRARIDTPEEIQYFRNGGILPYVLRNLARGA